MSHEKCNKYTNENGPEFPHSSNQSQEGSLKSSVDSPTDTQKAAGNISVQQFAELYANLDSADVTIYCGRNCDVVRAHRCVLSKGSVYFREALEMAPCKYPAIVVRNITGDEMRRILEYLYLGRITLQNESEFKQFTSSAKYLKLVNKQDDQFLVNE